MSPAPIEPGHNAEILLWSVRRCKTVIVVSLESLLRHVNGVMSTQYSCCTFQKLKMTWATNDNDNCDSRTRFRLSVRDETLAIGDAACVGTRLYYSSMANIATLLQCSLGLQFGHC